MSASGFPARSRFGCNEVTKSYSGAVALADVSLEVRERELALVFGRSGSGKSTLLMVAGGRIDPDRGSGRAGVDNLA